MGAFGSLQDEAELFSASMNLQYVASGLDKIINRTQIDENEAKNFEWAGYLTEEIVGSANPFHEKKQLELYEIAIILRPKFYEALSCFRIPFYVDLSERLCATLKSGGTDVRLGTEELREIRQAYQSMATGILNYLQHAHGNGQI